MVVLWAQTSRLAENLAYAEKSKLSLMEESGKESDRILGRSSSFCISPSGWLKIISIPLPLSPHFSELRELARRVFFMEHYLHELLLLLTSLHALAMGS